MKKSILITGCSDGGLGAALAIAFHRAGHRVIASARNLKKLEGVKAVGIETVQLDVVSSDSIQQCVAEISKRLDGKLDVLINNAGANYITSVMDIEAARFRELLELNTLSVVATSQAFLPLLRASASGGMIVNNTSVLAVVTVAWSAAYNATKAATSAITQAMRLELQPLGVKVVELRTGGVKTRIFENTAQEGRVPHDSVYAPAREVILKKMADVEDEIAQVTADSWAKQVVHDLSKSSPPVYVWRGHQAQLARWGQIFPTYVFDGMVSKITGLDVVKQIFAARGKSG